jgi:HD-like signal output (HDOD) protein
MPELVSAGGFGSRPASARPDSVRGRARFSVTLGLLHTHSRALPLYNRSVIPPLQGQLSTVGFADLLQWMELNRRSGRVTVMRGRDRRIIDWKDGEIVYVSGSHPRDRLGVFLRRTGALPQSVIHTLLAHNFTSHTNLTRLILEGHHDTVAGLSRRVEELARRLLFEVFEWRDAVFRFDPSSPVEKILRIRLRMRPQALTFQAVKSIDDARRRRRRRLPTGFREALFEGDEIDRRFWHVVERAGDSVEANEGRRRFEQMRDFANRLRRRIGRIEALRPVHEDSVTLLRELLKRKPFELSAVVPVAALDPFLTLDLLVLANSLVVNRRRSVATAQEALTRLGPVPVAALVHRLADSDFPRVAQEDRAGVAVRRASIAAAVAAQRRAGEFGIAPDRAYALGLLHTVPYADLIAVVEEMELAPSRFRAALIEVHRPLVGRLRAEGWSLPVDLEAVLTDDVTHGGPAVALIRAARATLTDCALGSLSPANVSARETRAAALEVNRLFEFLSLPAAGGRGDKPGH